MKLSQPLQSKLLDDVIGKIKSIEASQLELTTTYAYFFSLIKLFHFKHIFDPPKLFRYRIPIAI
jgi:hypothetical protein